MYLAVHDLDPCNVYTHKNVSMDTDCFICRVDLGVPAFVAPGPNEEDLEVSSEVFRLRCGHAYHNGCLCRALRGDSGCPVCRGRVGPVPGSAVLDDGEWTLQFTADGTAVIRMSVDDGERDYPDEGLDAFQGPPMDEFERASAFVTALESVRSLAPIQMLRREVNQEKKRYRKLVRELMDLRAQHIGEALRSFKQAQHARFKEARRALKRRLRRLQNAELDRLRALNPQFVDDSRLFGPGEWDIARLADLDIFGPHKHKFWNQNVHSLRGSNPGPST